MEFGVSTSSFKSADVTERVLGGEKETYAEKGDAFDDFRTKVVLGHGVSQFGDMVWGKIKSYPWWPGQIFHEAFAVAEVRRTKKQGHVLVAFFGDCTYAWLDPKDIVPFGPYYTEKFEQTNAKAFVDAVVEAEHEVGRRAALGLLCQCRNACKFRPTSVNGILSVDVGGYAPGALYTVNQIQSFKDGFECIEMLGFVKQLALIPGAKFLRNIRLIMNVGLILAFRRAVLVQNDEAYAGPTGAQPPSPLDSSLMLTNVLSENEVSQETFLEVLQAQPSLVYPKVMMDRFSKDLCGGSLNGLLKVASSNGQSKSSARHTVFNDQHKFDKDVCSIKVETDFNSSHDQEECLVAGRNLVLQRSTTQGGATMDKHSTFKPNSLVDAKVEWEIDSEALPSASKPPKKRFRPEDYYVKDKGYGSTHGVGDMYSKRLEDINELKSSLSAASVIGNEKPWKLQDWLKPDSSIFGAQEMFSKRREKPETVELLSNAKKIDSEKHFKLQATAGKEADMKVLMKAAKDSLTQHRTSIKVAKPTMLIIKFPRQSILPSVSELEAKFGSFGPFDSTPRVFWKSSTCRIIFKYECDAQVARRYAVQDRTLFGHVNINYDVQPLKIPSPVSSTSNKQKQKAEKSSPVPSMNSGYHTNPMSEAASQQQLPIIHPQSVMKNQQPDEGQSTISKPYGDFLLGRNEDVGEDQLMIVSTLANMADPHNEFSSSSQEANTAENSNKIASSSLPSCLPMSYQTPNVLENREGCNHFADASNQEYVQVGGLNQEMHETTQNSEFSTQILDLLVRCDSIVGDLQSLLGYVPSEL
ncbi:hypothetical protein Tsubulata_037445 [Turnera subulata]|uniref:PWWP domain-containing protein n=1 Tax=Turnera subulata TaxID=218843 RepID=A0A9Q0JN68_9ROSI|nr:hypothetical protein Tsubulata_037445 [Turnera subulata]